MSPISHPAIALPEPLRAAEIPSFTNYSVVVRLPDIARRTLKENDFSPETIVQVQALIDEIPSGKIRQIDTPLAPDSNEWAGYIRRYEGMDWLEIPWFFAEEYFYRRILEATGYYQPGDTYRRDPYAGQKRMGLASSRVGIQTLADQVGYIEHRPRKTNSDSLSHLLLLDLWGNQNDLSLWPVQQEENGTGLTGGTALDRSKRTESNGKDDHNSVERKNILSDQLPAVLDFINRLDPSTARVDILLDNAGYELVCDLALADFLLTSQCAAQVTLHAKTYPVFVSDALNRDIHETIDSLFFEGHLSSQAMAIRLRRSLVSGSLVIRHHPFWTSPLAAWEMPAELFDQIGQADLLISKGDANYRRLLGDRHWPIELPFASVVDYLPCAVLALRTLKSEIAVGIDPGLIPASDPDWMIDGRWGVVEFSPSH
jgi:hypothetical protein